MSTEKLNYRISRKETMGARDPVILCRLFAIKPYSIEIKKLHSIFKDYISRIEKYSIENVNEENKVMTK